MAFSPTNLLRALTTRALCRWCPGVVNRILYRRRASFWYRTARGTSPQRVWGYADGHSIAPGEACTVRLGAPKGKGQTSPVGHLEIFRIGVGREPVHTSERVEVPLAGVDNTASALGPGFPVATAFADTADWRSGYYSIDFVHADGQREEDVAFTIVRGGLPGGGAAGGRAPDVLVKLATATYQAYNKWGGHNLYLYESPNKYDGGGMGLFESDLPANIGRMVSFDRPTASEFWEWEHHFVRFLEELAAEHGFSVGYTTNFDYATRDEGQDDCLLLVSPGHDEYWSVEEFERHHARVFAQGGHTLFLGANTAYWQVRYVDVDGADHARGRQLVCHKSIDDPIGDARLATARFRDGARLPETMLLGVAYQSNFDHRRQLVPAFDLSVVDPGVPFFRDTGLAEGDSVGPLVGHEWDNRDPERERPPPGETRIAEVERLWNAARSRIPEIPLDRIRVLFAGDAVDVFGHPGRAESVFYESDAGAKVFSSGTNRWNWGLAKDGFVDERFRKFNRNLILDLLEKPS